MFQKIRCILLFIPFYLAGYATHNRAGEIIYRHISGTTYEFTLTMFTYTGSPVDRTSLDITWGDNTMSTVPRTSSVVLPGNYYKNVYVARHTYPGAGVYTIMTEDPNRNAGVENIPNSVGVVFSITTIFRISPNFIANNAPQMLAYPIDRAALGQTFIHNPSAYDVDGDSLSYEIAVSTREKGVKIEGYTFPEASDSLVVDAVSGDLIWATPVKTGIYNIAMKIFEWRQGIKISSITRDMQIEVIDSKNRPPVNQVPSSRCVEAGTLIEFDVLSTDPDNDKIIQTAYGGPFEMLSNPAQFTEVSSEAGKSVSHFMWQTNNGHVRKQPYTIVIKAEDQNSEVNLVAFSNINITVLAPKVENLKATAMKKTVMLNWEPSVCEHASGYEIYRSIGHNNVVPDSCAGGIPPGSGYEKTGEVKGRNTTNYEDTNQGKGLSPGIEYCYRVVAVFADGAKSFPSNEACAVLLAGVPPMIKADVKILSETGEVEVAWLRKPLTETLKDKNGPFQYSLYRQIGSREGSRELLYQTMPPDKILSDTVFIDKNINTLTVYPYYYEVELWNMEAGNEYQIEENETASTLYPKLNPTDKAVEITFKRHTPWVNSRYDIFRCSTGLACDTADFVYAGTATGESYTDAGLLNGQTYCYRLKSYGYRLIDGSRYENINRSHIACATPLDNVPPCAPELAGISNCNEVTNHLSWTYGSTCTDDVEKYRMYFSPDREQIYTKTDSVSGNDFSYRHIGTVRGCYYVTAVDNTGNESTASNIVCLDECGIYELPNVFTPNGDNINDVFKSYNPAGIKKVDMKIFNRWGKIVFKTDDAAINWDGRDIDSKQFVPSGVYYYTCDVFEERLNSVQIKTLNGFVHLYYDKGASPLIID
jgi:gliding motility-associated-like protein